MSKSINDDGVAVSVLCVAKGLCVMVCRERKFVLSYFLADDTLSIFEPPQRNTGITGGKYLERSKVHYYALAYGVHVTV